MSDLSKQLEEARADRRARARARVASGEFTMKKTQPTPKPKPIKIERVNVDKMIEELEVAVQDCLADMPDVGESDAYHDIAVNIRLSIPHPDDRREFARRAGLLWDEEDI